MPGTQPPMSIWAQAPGYVTPAQNPPVGTPLAPNASTPTLFTPLQLRGLTLSNRFAVSPMCMDSALNGLMTDFHLVHLGSFALRGAALTIFEATSVLANGRITTGDVGLWNDAQIAPMKRIVDFIHAQGQHAGIQLAHAGRKAGNLPGHDPLLKRGVNDMATVEDGGWPEDVWAPSAIPYNGTYAKPKALSTEQVEGMVRSFAEAAERALKVGFDTMEIHAAHGYLLSEFLSPITNVSYPSPGSVLGEDANPPRRNALTSTAAPSRTASASSSR